jgi:hypothetical protein
VDHEYGVIDLSPGIAMGAAKSGVMNAQAGQDLAITKAVVVKECIRLSSHSTVSLSRRRAFRGCLHVVSCMVLLPVRTCSGEKEAEQDYCYGRAMSAYTRSLHERTRVIRG